MDYKWISGYTINLNPIHLYNQYKNALLFYFMDYYRDKNLDFWLEIISKYNKKCNKNLYTKYVCDTLTRYIIYSKLNISQIDAMKKFYQLDELQLRYNNLINKYELNNIVKYSENCKLYLIKAIYIESLKE